MRTLPQATGSTGGFTIALKPPKDEKPPSKRPRTIDRSENPVALAGSCRRQPEY